MPAARAPAARARGGLLAAGAAAAAVVLIMASVVPLALLQLPNLIASELPAATVARIAGHDSVVSLARAAGLALPVMAFVAPVAAVLARRKRAWPALLAGLILIGAADLLGDSVHSVVSIGADRALHGLGAGIALPATLALAWERPPRWCRLLARWWVVVTVVSFAGLVPFMRDRLASGDWRIALQPFPWLTAAGLATTALYVALTGGSGRQARTAVTPAERSQLALLAVPLAGLGALDVGVSNVSGRAVAVAAGVAVLVLTGLALAASSDPVTGGPGTGQDRGARRRLSFPLVAAAAGFALGPTTGMIATLRPLTGGPYPALRALWLPLTAAAAACVVGTGIGWLCGRRTAGAHAASRRTNRMNRKNPANGESRGGPDGKREKRNPGGRRALGCVLAGLACAAAGLLTAYAAAHMAAHAGAPAVGSAGRLPELAAAYALLCGGLTMALTAGVAAATSAGALAGLSLALAGALTGYLAAGAIQIRVVNSTAYRTPAVAGALNSALNSALTSAAGWWEVTAAAAMLATAAGVALLGRPRRPRRSCREPASEPAGEPETERENAPENGPGRACRGPEEVAGRG